RRTTMKKAAAILSLALTTLPMTASAASANDLVDSNPVEKVECIFRVYVNEGGENGLDCLT
ncbi:MAG TPA: hypothetical protein VHJ76_07275, partial [Actinomycetota bacterium]|nr:hypothetical protein [Actinomycetota bacterium]